MLLQPPPSIPLERNMGYNYENVVKMCIFICQISRNLTLYMLYFLKEERQRKRERERKILTETYTRRQRGRWRRQKERQQIREKTKMILTLVMSCHIPPTIFGQSVHIHISNGKNTLLIYFDSFQSGCKFSFWHLTN